MPRSNRDPVDPLPRLSEVNVIAVKQKIEGRGRAAPVLVTDSQGPHPIGPLTESWGPPATGNVCVPVTRYHPHPPTPAKNRHPLSI